MNSSFQIEVGSERIIRGNLLLAEVNPSPITLIICHGYKGYKDWGFFPYAAGSFAKHVNVIIFNFSHNGVGALGDSFDELEKFARNTYARELEDLDVLIKSLRKEKDPLFSGLGNSRIYLLGHSRGGAVALLYGLDQPEEISGIVTWNGVTEPEGIFTKQQVEQMRQEGRSYVENARTKQQMPLDVEIIEDLDLNKERYNLIQRSKGLEIAVLAIQGDEDFERLKRGRKDLLNNQPAIRQLTVAGGNHTFGTVHPFRGTTEALETAIAETVAFMVQPNTDKV
ncbi:hypothetical protein SY83_15245 [Paenibacillus swuensis]|uniref:AB hydrolase-1 domain-containing protein n=2 Tax=Paenibacillus swuensis TaxID=1178515 RepID=A0A172TK17_9BACL|nr:hypothetical protein SY83_15245 [Paenibacillus swuensis]